MAIEKPTFAGHPIGEPHVAGLVVPDEFLELGLGELRAARAHQMMPAIMLPVARLGAAVAAGPQGLELPPALLAWQAPRR